MLRVRTQSVEHCERVLSMCDASRVIGTVPNCHTSSTDHQSSGLPQLSRRDIKEAFQWRIRNLPYPPDTYALSVDPDSRSIVVRTTNKKYFKKIHVPELEILELAIDEQRLQWQHNNNTLIITYSKPPGVREADALELKAVRAFRTGAENGNTDCKQQ